MKKFILVLGLATLFSCEKEEVALKKEDCDCDRVFKVERTIYKTSNNGNGSVSVYQCYNIYTVNDCSKFNDVKEYIDYEGKKVPEIGSCF